MKPDITDSNEEDIKQELFIATCRAVAFGAPEVVAKVTWVDLFGNLD